MNEHKLEEGPQTDTPRFVRDVQLAPMIAVSVTFLQKDRIGARRIPFIRLGDRCLYDPKAVFAALEEYAVGGPRMTRRAPRSKP